MSIGCKKDKIEKRAGVNAGFFVFGGAMNRGGWEDALMCGVIDWQKIVGYGSIIGF